MSQYHFMYQTVTSDPQGLDEKLNKLGADGWRVISIVARSDAAILVATMERVLEVQSPPEPDEPPAMKMRG